MRRRLSWTLVGMVVWVGMLVTGCGGTGGAEKAAPGQPFVFIERGRLNLTAFADPNTPARLTLIATLLDPRGTPLPNQLITFTAEFPDTTIIPGNDNTGAVRTDNNGQAQVILIAGLTTGRMRVVAEAPPQLNIATAITVTLTTQGFISLGPLDIIPDSVTFVNPAQGATADFQATGGSPPYRFFNSNPSVGRIATLGNIGEIGRYTLTGPLPTTEEEPRQDTITLQDAASSQATASVQVLFVTCGLSVFPKNITFSNAVGGEVAQIAVPDAVPPITVTQTFPAAGRITVDNNAKIVTFTVATPPVGVAPNTLLIRDSRGCTATVEITVTPRVTPTLTITPASATVLVGQSVTFVITGGQPPYSIAANGGTANPTTVSASGGTFVYTAGTTRGTFSIVVTDQRGNVAQALVTIQ